MNWITLPQPPKSLQLLAQQPTLTKDEHMTATRLIAEHCSEYRSALERAFGVKYRESLRNG